MFSIIHENKCPVSDEVNFGATDAALSDSKGAAFCPGLLKQNCLLLTVMITWKSTGVTNITPTMALFYSGVP